MLALTFPDGVAVIFGGSGGIGRGVAEQFAQAGSAVAVCYNSKRDVAEETVAELHALGVKASAHQVDVRDAAAVVAVLADVVAEYGRIHTLVWGAGSVVEQIAVAETSPAQYRRSVEIETLGMYTAVHAVLPHFREQGGGSIVHLGSAGDRWFPQLDGLSVIPKAANEALVRGIAKEEGAHGIRANSVLVGVIEAGMFLELQAQGVFDEEWTREVHKLVPLKRWGKPADIGSAAVFLASEQANYITGQQISVSGGFGV
ncbi:SDR family oxidoreductase [Rhodococcus hoagii]|nr:SDR family oxidoreductase [Prescottella equi]NKS74196.1 SDR family oxidoreductase [Prescottella equi]NKZ88432.1 SDR family oxidoreductase [Prescottella equi]